MEKVSKKDLLSIPNILGYFRILLIPVFIILYFMAKSDKGLYLAAFVVLVSGLTDLADGYIARHYNMVTELGKFIDPLADKLTQISVFICLTSRFPAMWLLVVLSIIKEGYMSIKGLTMYRKGKKLNGAAYCGKICTTLLYITMFSLLFFVSIPLWLANTMIFVCAVDMIITLYLYIRIYQTL